MKKNKILLAFAILGILSTIVTISIWFTSADVGMKTMITMAFATGVVIVINMYAKKKVLQEDVQEDAENFKKQFLDNEEVECKLENFDDEEIRQLILQNLKCTANIYEDGYISVTFSMKETTLNKCGRLRFLHSFSFKE